MKPRLIILSDLWGKEKSFWIQDYVKLLDTTFEIKYYDCCVLGNVTKSKYDEENLHYQFVNGGIEKAVAALLRKETEQVTILAFSIGGTIAWKAALNGLKVNALFAISSTRLRYETQVPECKIKLHYAQQDHFKPDASWFKKYQIGVQINKNKTHLMYVEKDFIHLICNEILEQNS